MAKDWHKDSVARPKVKAEPAARALLALGSSGVGAKDSLEDSSLLEDQQILDGEAGSPGAGQSQQGPRPDNFYTDTNVEEAVMRLVGGTLQDDRTKKRKMLGQFDHDIPAFPDYISNGSWDKFLSDDITTGHHDDYSLFDHPTGEPIPRQPPSATAAPRSHSEAAVTNQAQNNATGPEGSRKKRRTSHQMQGQANAGVVDPALAHINSGNGQNLVGQSMMGKDHHLLQQGLSLGQGMPQGMSPGISPGIVPTGLSQGIQNGMVGHPHTAGVMDKKSPSNKITRSTWGGDGSETFGSFDESEVKALDDFMNRFCQQNNLDRRGLCERVWASERKKDNFWDAVAAVLPHRTRASVYKHVRRTYHVFTVRGKWSSSEDHQLDLLFHEKGAQWKAIGLAMHRMPEDCRDRWRNYVKCGGQRNQNKWSAKEEELLAHVVTDILSQDPTASVNWTTVSERMGGTRSRIQCRYKWKKLSRKLQ